MSTRQSPVEQREREALNHPGGIAYVVDGRYRRQFVESDGTEIAHETVVAQKYGSVIPNMIVTYIVPGMRAPVELPPGQSMVLGPEMRFYISRRETRK